MADLRRYQRVVAWTNGSGEAGHATAWAARHAAARRLPLHVLRIPRVAVLAGAARSHSLTAGDDDAPQDGRAADEIRLLRAEYPSVQIDGEVVEDDYGLPAPGILEPHDILVTWPSGYLDLLASAEPDEQVATHVPVPTVFVPDGADVASSSRRVLLLTAPWFFREAASFAFTAAAELGATMDVVRLPTDYDDMLGPGLSEHGPSAVGPRLRCELAKLRGRFLGLPGDVHTLGNRPWSALRDLTRAADLAVLGVGMGRDVDIRAVYDLGTCPVAIVPESPVPTAASRAARTRLRPESRSPDSRLRPS